MKKDLERFCAGITDVRLALWPCSWGRIQCTAETAEGKIYESWSGDPRDDLSIKLILKSFELIGKQLKEKE